MSLYRVHFKWKEKDLILRAKSLDLTHPYFVSIKGLVFPEGNGLIIDPAADEVRRTFGRADHLMIPFQTVSLIEEYSDEKAEMPSAKVRSFTLVEKEGGEEEEAAENGDLDSSDSSDSSD